MDFATIISFNKDVLSTAREMNLRANQDIFHVQSEQEMKEFYLKVLDGATSMSEVKNWEALKLPALDQDMLLLIEEEYPTMILVENEEIKIEYTLWSKSVPMLNFQFSQKSLIKALENQWKIPFETKGRYLRFCYNNFIEASLEELYEKVIEEEIKSQIRRLNQDLEENVFTSLREISPNQFGACRKIQVLGKEFVVYESLRFACGEYFFQLYQEQEEALEDTISTLNSYWDLKTNNIINEIIGAEFFTENWLRRDSLLNSIKAQIEQLTEEWKENPGVILESLAKFQVSLNSFVDTFILEYSIFEKRYYSLKDKKNSLDLLHEISREIDQILWDISMTGILSEENKKLDKAERLLNSGSNFNEIEEEEEDLEDNSGNTVVFTDIGKRFFACQCGYNTRLNQSDFKDYKAGETLEIECYACGGIGEIENSQSSDKKPKDSDLSSSLDAIRQKWGK